MSDNSSINIEINVVDGSGSISTINATTAAVAGLGQAGAKATADLGGVGAASGVMGSSVQTAAAGGKSAIARMTEGCNDLGRAFVVTSSSANSLGEAFELMGAKGAASLDEFSNSADDANLHLTSLQSTMLLGQDFGFRLSRGMEAAISKSSVLSGAISQITGLLVGIGVVEIFYRMCQAIYDAYQKYISLNSAAEDYAATVQKQRDADFTNTHSIEETTHRIQEADQAAQGYKKTADSLSESGWKDASIGWGTLLGTMGQVYQQAKGLNEMFGARQSADQGYAKQAQAVALTAKQLSDQHELTIAQINTNHASDGALQGHQKINAELAKSLALNKENTDFTMKQDGLLQNGNQHSGRQKQALEDQTAQAQATAQGIELDRQAAEKQGQLAKQVRDRNIAMQDEARNSGLQGNALYFAQEQEAIAAVERSATGSAAQVASIRVKFHNEELQRLQAETDEVNKRARAEQEAALTGLALIQAKGQDAQNDIQQKQDLGGYASAADADRDRQIAHDATLREMGDAEKQFNEQVAALSEQSANRMLTGVAKIDATRDAAIEKLAADWQKMYSDMDQTSAQFAAGQAMLDQGVAAISADADRERSQAHAKTMADIEATEVSAARTMQTEDKAATGAIIDDYNRRLAQAINTRQQQLASTKLSAEEQAQVWQEYYARIQADADLAGAQMQRAAQQTRDKLADSLGDLFSDPQGFLEKRAKDMMYKVLANSLMSATNNLQSQSGQWLAQMLGLGPDMAAPTGNGGGFGAAFGLAKKGADTGAPQLSTAASSLTSASSQLATSGTTLSSSGTQLAAAATALQSAATALASSRAAGGSGGGGGLGSLFGGGGDSGDDGLGGGADDFAGSTLAGDPSSLYSSASGGFAPGFDASSTAAASSGVESSLSSAGSSAQSSGLSLGSGSTLGKGVGIAGGAIAGGLALYNGYKNSDPLGGALAGASAGATIGGLFGPEGMLIGAGIGAVAGAISGFLGELFGDNGRGKAKAYDTGTVGPALTAELQNFNSGQTGYTQASRDLQNILTQAQSSTASMGSGARKYFTETITPEVAAVQSKLDLEERAGRSKTFMSAAQFHTGGLITSFGDMGTSSTEGFIHALMGERVMNPQASAAHGPMLDAMNAGHTFTPLLSSQARGAISSIAGGSTTRMGAGGGQGMQLTITAIDAASFERQLKYGGLGRKIEKHFAGQPGDYGGKADA